MHQAHTAVHCLAPTYKDKATECDIALLSAIGNIDRHRSDLVSYTVKFRLCCDSSAIWGPSRAFTIYFDLSCFDPVYGERITAKAVDLSSPRV